MGSGGMCRVRRPFRGSRKLARTRYLDLCGHSFTSYTHGVHPTFVSCGQKRRTFDYITSGGPILMHNLHIMFDNNSDPAGGITFRLFDYTIKSTDDRSSHEVNGSKSISVLSAAGLNCLCVGTP